MGKQSSVLPILEMNNQVPYQLIRSKRRTLALLITRECKVIVRAPQKLPQKEIDRFLEAHTEWIRSHLLQQQQKAQAEGTVSPEERVEYIRQANEILPKRTALFADVMGVFPTKIRITDAKARFGSCSAKNRICFSWRLMRYPKEAIDYVVVHELAHIRYKNHGAEFYQLIASVFPDYRKRWALLKEPPIK
jgi:hypothetical protein